MVRILPLLCIFLAAHLHLHAQEEFIYANFNKNITLTNPAMMGMDTSTSFTAFGRRQWTGINDAPVSASFTGSTFLGRLGISAGLAAEYKKVAVTSYTSIGAMLSKTVRISESERITLGFFGGMDNFSARYGALGNGDPAFQGKQPVNLWRGVVGFGLTLHGDNFYIGASMPRIKLKSYNDDTQLRPEDTGNSGYVAAGMYLPLGSGLSLAPAVMYNIMPEDRPLDIGATLIFRESVGAGLTWRSTGEMNAALQYSFQRSFQVGYSYIFAVGHHKHISRFSSGSHEVFVHYRIPWRTSGMLPYKWW